MTAREKYVLVDLLEKQEDRDAQGRFSKDHFGNPKGWFTKGQSGNPNGCLLRARSWDALSGVIRY